MKRNRIAIFLLLVGLVLVNLANGGITTTNPDATRYDRSDAGSWGITYNFTTTSDSMIWIGWEASSGTVLRMNANVQITPLTNPGRTIADGTSIFGSRNIANPRAGSLLFQWGADTLTTTLPELNYCCGGLLGFRVKGIGTAGYVKIYVTKEK